MEGFLSLLPIIAIGFGVWKVLEKGLLSKMKIKDVELGPLALAITLSVVAWVVIQVIICNTAYIGEWYWGHQKVFWFTQLAAVIVGILIVNKVKTLSIWTPLIGIAVFALIFLQVGEDVQESNLQEEIRLAAIPPPNAIPSKVRGIWKVTVGPTRSEGPPQFCKPRNSRFFAEPEDLSQEVTYRVRRYNGKIDKVVDESGGDPDIPFDIGDFTCIVSITAKKAGTVLWIEISRTGSRNLRAA